MSMQQKVSRQSRDYFCINAGLPAPTSSDLRFLTALLLMTQSLWQ